MNADKVRRVFMWGAIAGAGLSAVINIAIFILTGGCS